jgi:hypothetical protein
MGLVKHNPDYRRIWMFPRNIRRIHPWKIAQICILFNQFFHTESWSGNQTMQNKLCKALEKAGLKTVGVQRDLNSGGPRTYFAQLKCLGLIFQREGERVWFTKAGEDLVNGKPPLEIVQNLLFRHQYPSSYGNLGNVKIHPKLKVKPFLFVLELLLAKRIKFLTNEELCIPVLYGHNDSCLKICISKILKLRRTRNFAGSIDNENEDLFTAKTNFSAFDEKASNYIGDIANTCKNYLQACCLIVETKNDAGEKCIQVNDDMIPLVKQAIKVKKKYVKIGVGEESFQRALGSWDSKKDTRRLSKKYPTLRKKHGEPIIEAEFIKYCGKYAIVDYPNDFINEINRNFGFGKSLIKRTIQPFLEKSLSYYESTFLGMSRGGTSTATDFERAVCGLFRNRFHFEAEHIGQRKRPKGGPGGYADVFIVALDKSHCAIIDAKASPAYRISNDDYLRMAKNYIVNYNELSGGRVLDLEYCLYVAGGLHEKSVNQKLKQIKKDAAVNASAITAFELLQLSKRNIATTQQSRIRAVFKKTRVVYNSDF